MENSYFQMNVTLEFEVSGGRVRSYDFTISGNSFKEIKDRAKTLYAEISDSDLMTMESLKDACQIPWSPNSFW